jgi:hypothetical protein
LPPYHVASRSSVELDGADEFEVHSDIRSRKAVFLVDLSTKEL